MVKKTRSLRPADFPPPNTRPPALPPADDEAFVLYSFPGHLVRRLQQASVALFSRELEQAGIDITSVQYGVLKAADRYPLIDQVSLASVVAFDQATIGGVIGRLERKKLVKRRTSASDRRVRQLVIEPRGKALIAAMDPLVHAVQDKLLSPLDRAERKTLVALLDKLVRAHSKDGPAAKRNRKTNGASAAKRTKTSTTARR